MLAPLEKRVLVWLAERMPASINPDHLTVLGLLSLAFAGLSYWWASANSVGLVLVIFFLLTNWFGDSLDGTLARVRKRQRPRYGFYVDHVVDMFGTFFLLGGLGLSGYMSLPVAIALIIIYFMLSIEVYLTTYTIGTFHLSFWKFSPTELRILLIIGNLVALSGTTHGVINGERYLLFDIGGVVGVIGMSAMLLWAVIRHTLHLYNAERLSQVLLARWLKFNAVGATGIVVQLAVLALLKSGLGLNYLVATAIAVEIAVLNNFYWHVRWTWADRHAPLSETLKRCLKFHLANGLLSLISNLILMRLLVGRFHIPYLIANLIAIGLTAVANFVASEFFVFRHHKQPAP